MWKWTTMRMRTGKRWRLLDRMRRRRGGGFDRDNIHHAGRDSSVGIAIRYGLVRGSNPGGCEIGRTRPDRLWGPPSLLYSGYRAFPGHKAVGAWRRPPTPSSAEVKERVKLYLYYPSGPSWSVLGWTVPLVYIMHVCIRSYNAGYCWSQSSKGSTPNLRVVIGNLHVTWWRIMLLKNTHRIRLR
jgi:hypothetical protein